RRGPRALAASAGGPAGLPRPSLLLAAGHRGHRARGRGRGRRGAGHHREGRAESARPVPPAPARGGDRPRGGRGGGVPRRGALAAGPQERAMRLLVRATNWVGDAVMALPALRAVRARWPAAHIAILALPYVGEIYQGQEVADELLSYERRGA